MKTLYNILLLIIIGIMASTYIFTLSPIDYSGHVDIPELSEVASLIRLRCDEGTDLTNPNTIVLTLVPDNENDISMTSENLFYADIYKGDELIVSNFTDLESVSIHFTNGTSHISRDNPMRTTLDISQDNLGLEAGSYTIVINSTVKELTEENKSIRLNVSYTDNAVYSPATNTAPENKTGITLYFSDKQKNVDNDVLIPVTRFVDFDKSLNKKVIEELKKGPLSENMSKTIGEINYTTFFDEVVYIDIPSKDTTYSENSTQSAIAYYSLLKSMYTLQNYLDFSRVKFTVDNAKGTTFFHGVNIENSIPYSYNDKAYLAFRLIDRYYLTDFKVYTINKNDSLEIKAEKMFEFLKDNKMPYVKNPISEDIILQSATPSNGTLILDFNEAFTDSFEARDDLKRMMIDSLAYSFTSLKTINSISITVNGEYINDFVEGIDMSNPIYPAKYINPE